MSTLVWNLGIIAGLAVLTVAAGLALAAAPLRRRPAPRDVFGFARQGAAPVPVELQRYAARDGAQLAYRFYDAETDRLLVFLHGSSYHGGGYHALASFLSERGTAKVVLPNLRGHFQSGGRRGDVDYIGQLEDDIADLIGVLRAKGLTGPIILGGHSSGGGLAIRFAAGPHGAQVERYLLLAPVIPTSPAIRQGTAGGWASLNGRRLAGLIILNIFGIHGFDALPIIEFNKPEALWDGTETLGYSYRLNMSYHPRYRYRRELRTLGDKGWILVGAEDEAVDAEALRAIFAQSAPRSPLMILPRVTHFGIFSEPAVLELIAGWLTGTPAVRP